MNPAVNASPAVQGEKQDDEEMKCRSKKDKNDRKRNQKYHGSKVVLQPLIAPIE